MVKSRLLTFRAGDAGVFSHVLMQTGGFACSRVVWVLQSRVLVVPHAAGVGSGPVAQS